MEAIEFMARLKNGAIEVPEEYLKQLKHEFRVIILLQEEKPKKEKKTRQL